MLIGTNTADCHPVIFKRIKKRKQSDPKRVTIIAVDPRRTETADFADLHLPIQPGTDIALLNSMLCVLIEENLIDREFVARHTNGFRELEEIVKKYPPKVAEEICGVPECLIVEAALIFGMAQSALSLWSMGVNQSSVGVQKNNAIINLHLATGKIGKPGSGPFSLTGQPNAMGGREVGGLSQHVARLSQRGRSAASRKGRTALGQCRAAALPRSPGLPALEQFEALAQGKLKAIWILCTNPGCFRAGHRPDRKSAAPSRARGGPRRLSSDRHQPFRSCHSCPRRSGAKKKA